MSEKDLGYIKGTLDALVNSHAELKVTLNSMVSNLKASQKDMETRIDFLEKHIDKIEDNKEQIGWLKTQVSFLYRGYYITIGAITVIMFVWSTFKEDIINFFTGGM